MSDAEKKDWKQMGAWIHTQYGEFHIDNPTFNPEAIAHALAMLCRYNGHTRVFYSVAEHSLLVAGLMAELKLGDPFEGLMHDAAEAYLSDIPSPWKQLVPDAVALEDRVERQLRQHFNLPASKTDGCNKADKLALFIESYYLIPSKGADYSDVLGVRPEAMALVNDHWKVHGFDPNLGKHLWMKGFKHYGPKIEVVEGDVEMQATRAESGKVVEGSSLVIP
jgi:uncharacterized protein